MISVSEYISANNPEGGMRIIKKYGAPVPANVNQMVEALNHVGRNYPESRKDFIQEHPDHKTFHSFYGQYHNVEGTIAQPIPEETSNTVSFYKQHENVIVIAGAILIAALILKK